MQCYTSLTFFFILKKKKIKKIQNELVFPQYRLTTSHLLLLTKFEPFGEAKTKNLILRKSCYLIAEASIRISKPLEENIIKALCIHTTTTAYSN